LDGTPAQGISFRTLSDDQVLPEGSFEEVDWDDEKIEEATGNAGATMERWFVPSNYFQI
jgi:hypothetical protein